MGVFLEFRFYEKNDSYVINNIPSLGLYEIHYQKAQPFRKDYSFTCKNGLSFLYETTKLGNAFELYFNSRTLLFWVIAEDLVDGSTITRINDEEFLCIFSNPEPALLFFEAINSILEDLVESEMFPEDEVRLVPEIVEQLKKAKEDNSLLHLVWC